MKILITGGLGYIGSHVATVLIQNDIDTVLIDTLENSRIQVLEGIESITGKAPVFRKIDVGEEIEMNQLFEEFPDIGGVIHFAAYKSVGESVSQPLRYYNNNLESLQQLLKYLIPNSIPLIFVRPSTKLARSLSNSFSISFAVIVVSSTTSCNKPAIIVV